MSKFEPIRTYKGKADGAYAGRTFAESPVFRQESVAILKEVGAQVKGPGAFLLPEGSEADTAKLVARLTEAAKADLAQLARDRKPVEAAVAANLKVGDTFDFGGSVGKAAITGFGQAFTAKASGIDDRLADLAGKETVYVYNANEPRAKLSDEEKAAAREARKAERAKEPKPELTDEQKAERAAACAAQTAERDKTRMIVLAGSVEAGDTVKVAGKQETVTKLGQEFTIADQDELGRLMDRFGDKGAKGLKVGRTYQFASFDAPEAVAKVEAEIDENDPTVMRDPAPM